MTNLGPGLVLFGLILVLAAYFAHDRGYKSTHFGQWRSAPGWFRRLVRFGDGPVLIWSVGLLTWALLVTAAGVMITVGAIPTELAARVGLDVILSGLILVLLAAAIGLKELSARRTK